MLSFVECIFLTVRKIFNKLEDKFRKQNKNEKKNTQKKASFISEKTNKQTKKKH